MDRRELFSTALGAILATSISAPAYAETRSGYAEVNGMKMYYEISGQGEPIVVLHGSFMNIPAMGPIIPELAKSHTVYAVEMQSHGRTNDIDRPITYPNMADDTAAFMDAVKLPKAVILGYSMGALIGLQLGIRHPDKVSKIVLVSGAYDSDGIQQAYRDLIPTMTVESFKDMPFATEYKRLNPNPDGYEEHVRKMLALEKEPMHWGDGVKALKSPMLILTGDSDWATLEHSVAMFKLVGGGVMGDLGKPLAASRLAVLPGTSHTAMITQLNLIMPMIEQFLKGETPKGIFDK